MSSDPFVQTVTASCAEAVKNLDLADGWKPDPGSYTIALIGVESGVEKGIAWIRPRFRIVDGDLKGREFTDYFKLDPAQKGLMGMTKCARLATVLAGAEVKDQVKCRDTMQSSIGAILIMSAGRKPNKKHVPSDPNSGPVAYADLVYLRRVPTT